ncbi:MAG: glutamate--tRNA ligase [Candidatus Acetothermia bacterium]|nr:glutamate--tRNA ligase [Candidatus Acetothermia bacterium]MDH7505775.1 glutamate--tRNA ligase [Candidatus Acetothermia bacterium]
MAPRVRFAPSPTGALHVGGARTALFNWLFARHHGGTFILRIEDTDRSRSTEESIEEIKAALRWLGLDWDEYYRETERFPLYQEAAERLLAQGKAYEREGAWWFRVPRPGTTVVHDLLLGDVAYDHGLIKDFVIRRSDGSFTYNFACAVDDADLGITHVIRANEHLNNTPRQILVYQALELEMPEFAHLPMVLSKERTKLSKRHGATSVFEYRDRGILPEALINFLVRLGWSCGDREIFSKEEMVALFDLKDVNVSAAVFDEEKLLWLNQHYLKAGDPERLGELLREFLMRQGIVSEEEAEAIPKAKLAKAIELFRERSETLVELAEKARFILSDRLEYDPKGVERFLTPEKGPLLEGLLEELAGLDESEFTAPRLEEATRAYLARAGHQLKEIAQTCRVALTGKTEGPGLFETMEVLEKAEVLTRLRRGLELIRQGQGA